MICAIAQLEALDFSGCGRWQRVHRLDPARIFPDAYLLLDILLQRLVEPILLGVRAHHDGFEDAWMRDQLALDLEGRYPDARHLEHVVASAAKGVAPIGVANIFVA